MANRHDLLNRKLYRLISLINKEGYFIDPEKMIPSSPGLVGSFNVQGIHREMHICTSSDSRFTTLGIMVKVHEECYTPDIDWCVIAINEYPNDLFEAFKAWMADGTRQELSGKEICKFRCYIYDPTWHDWLARNQLSMNFRMHHTQKDGFSYSVCRDNRTRSKKLIEVFRKAEKLGVGK